MLLILFFPLDVCIWLLFVALLGVFCREGVFGLGEVGVVVEAFVDLVSGSVYGVFCLFFDGVYVEGFDMVACWCLLGVSY